VTKRLHQLPTRRLAQLLLPSGRFFDYTGLERIEPRVLPGALRGAGRAAVLKDSGARSL